MKRQETIIRGAEARDRVASFIGNLNPERPWLVTVQPHRKRRTLSQNRMMWKWINEVADLVGEHSGYSSDDIHEFFKKQFLPASGRHLVNINGTSVERLTTTGLTTTEMTEYMNRIEAWAATDLGLMLPHPEDTQRYW